MTEPVFIIAEAGVNHNGSVDLAQRLVDAAADAGADAVKFQTYEPHELVSSGAEKAAYQVRATGASESQLEMLSRLRLDREAHRLLAAQCRARGLQFLSTPFDLGSLELLVRDFDLPRIKVASGEITNGPLLLAVGRTGRPIILSTGMSTLSEVEAALGVLAFGCTHADGRPGRWDCEAAYLTEEGQRALREKVVLLHCTTEYPAPFEEVHLRAMETMRLAFRLPVGYSDHTPGIAVPVAAVALGAVVIEKHFTLDRDLPGPDHGASLEPDELSEMVRSIRAVEVALGSGMKAPSPAELRNRGVARKSLIAGRPIAAGEVFDETNLAVKRPGTGISPLQYWEWVGRLSARAYAADELIAP